ncbi:hypothetical protein KPL35_15385 [Clostridium sp. CF011]|uniref:hypothetical protein n=1 Tax=Clostridium sp. CF011 TaxID=2843318 RepID=UPI001C0B5B6A|nr:hypothetical protein [Clostridium sp. CF011]MBU3093446.1 hypothetical protein [Clostridium sp. CF011]WAG68753.1 hypothetical protein LL036_11670 [Clostridium sp. CF011]
MEDKYLEELLFELGNEDINLPKNLVQNTKEKIYNKHLLSIICMSVFFNIISLISLITIIYLKFNFKGIIGLYILYSFFSSLSILPLIFFKGQFKLKFSITI